jgi:hypothetical protein
VPSEHLHDSSRRAFDRTRRARGRPGADATPDDDLGERIHAIVDAPGGVDEVELRAHMADELVAYKCPATYEFVDEPVRDDAGKVRRSCSPASDPRNAVVRGCTDVTVPRR